jgi:hypothetical protein
MGVTMLILILNYLIDMNYKQFYIWLDGYLTGKLENKHIDIAPIVEKMGQVISDEEKWINDFKSYRKMETLNPIKIENSPE